jgi:predicted DCC family thiol-disulfide oxidoreductase YuxK
VNAEITDKDATGPAGWVFYDAECPLCVAGVRHIGGLFRRRGFVWEPLQAPDAAARLKLPTTELPGEMKLLLAGGRVAGGADACAELLRSVWWLWPLGWLMGLRLLRPVSRAAYRWLAQNRHCLGGQCGLPHTSRVGSPLRPADFVLALLIPSGSWLATAELPAWLRMWVLVAAEVFAVKWLMLRHAIGRGRTPAPVRQAAFLFGWAGTDANRFLRGTTEPVRLAEWAWAATHLFVGLALALAGAQTIAKSPVAGAWIGLVGMVLAGHFGGTQLIALLWRARGVDAPPLMRTPIAATSLAEFWGARWNLAFAAPARDLLFKPLARRAGLASATLAVFFVSGLLHETVIALPAGGGWGWPTAYFLAQGIAVLGERSRIGQALGLGRGARGWCFVLLCTAGPAWWLFPPGFATNVVAPMLSTLNPFAP